MSTNINNRQTFCVKCCFQFTSAKGEGWYLYEERIVAVLAENSDEAIEIAWDEGEKYEEKNNCYMLDYANSFNPFDDVNQILCNALSGSAEPIEIYSLMRDSQLPYEEYLTAFLMTGHERTN